MPIHIITMQIEMGGNLLNSIEENNKIKIKETEIKKNIEATKEVALIANALGSSFFLIKQ